MQGLAMIDGTQTGGLSSCYVIVKPHHEEDIFVITRGRGGAEAEV